MKREELLVGSLHFTKHGLLVTPRALDGHHFGLDGLGFLAGYLDVCDQLGHAPLAEDLLVFGELGCHLLFGVVQVHAGVHRPDDLLGFGGEVRELGGSGVNREVALCLDLCDGRGDVLFRRVSEEVPLIEFLCGLGIGVNLRRLVGLRYVC